MAYSPSFTRDRRGKWPAEANAGIMQVVGGSDAYLLEDDVNLIQWFLNEARADLVRKKVNSGVVDYTSVISNLSNTSAANQTLGQIQSSASNSLYPNNVGITPFSAYINGYKLNIQNAYVNNATVPSSSGQLNSIGLDAPPTANVTPSLPGSARDDLVFLEAWFQEVSSASGSADTNLYNYGGVNSGTMTNDILDPRINAETTRRVQFRWRIRVVDGVDFGKYPEGVGPLASDQSGLVAQGGNAAPFSTIYTTTSDPTYATSIYYSAANRAGTSNAGKKILTDDNGLYLAGDGSTNSKNLLNTLDGYVYAIPLFRVRRRNNAGFDPDSNPLGARDYYSVAGTMSYTTGQSTVTFTSSATLPTNVQVGDYVTQINAKTDNQITAITGNVVTIQLDLPNASSGTNVGATMNLAWSGRPDGLYSNIIDASDIIDLRHQVSLTGFNYQALLEKNLDLLLRGQLTTNAGTRYGRDYIGLNTGSYTDDANTLLYCKFDSSINGTANGTAVTGTMNTGSPSFVNGVQGEALAASTSQYVSYPISIASGTNTYAIELLFKPNWNWNDSTFRGILALTSGTPDYTTNVVSLYKTSSNVLFFSVYNNSASSTSSTNLTLPMSLANSITSGAWCKLLISVSNGVVSASINGVALTSSSTLTALPVAVSTLCVGRDWSYGAWANAAIDLVRISNIARTEQLLPSNFNGANGDKILDGPNADFNQWSDDLGGTAGLNGRTNPYGLSRVPNAIAARIAYNGSEIRHYYGNGLTPGYSASVAGATISGELELSGSYGINGEYIFATANESVDGVRTTFTFNAPSNPPYGTLLIPGAGSPSSVATLCLVGSSSPTISTATYGSNVYSVTFASAPANGSSVKAAFAYGSRHAHFIPSTKGFLIHDWTDDQTTNVNGTQTVFQTAKYGVTSVNHVRVTASGGTTGTIQNGGYTVSGTTNGPAIAALSASAASGATSITITQAMQSSAMWFNGQNIRISNGNGGWVYTTVTAAPSGASGTYTLTVSALPSAVSANAIVQGTAAVTFTTAPAAGSNVDIVYESVLTPSLGDYLRVCYQHTPYQGTIAASDSYTILAESNALVTSLGTGAVYTGSYSGTAGMTACTTNLPTAVPDANLKNDAFIGTTRSGVTAKQMIQSTWDDVPYSSTYLYHSKRVGTTLSINTILAPVPRGLATQNIVGSSGVWYFYTEQISAAVPTKAILAQLVKDQNGVVRLLVYVRQQATNQPQIDFGVGSNTAVDSFHIQGRPLVKGYGNVAA